MKGQIFIITSILILLALYITRISTKTIDLKKDETIYESFSNLKNEIIKTIDLALLNQENVEEKLYDFISFSKEVLKKRGYNESVDYFIDYYGQTTTVYLNVSLKSSNSYLFDNLIINRTVYT